MNQELYKKLREHLDENPDSLVFARLGEMVYQMGKAKTAIGLLTKGINNYPTYTTALVVLGKILLSEGDKDKAFELLKKAVQLEPSNISALFYLSKAALASENYKLFVFYALQILSLCPHDTAIVELLAEHWNKIQESEPELAKMLLSEKVEVTKEFIEEEAKEEAAEPFVVVGTMPSFTAPTLEEETKPPEEQVKPAEIPEIPETEKENEEEPIEPEEILSQIAEEEIKKLIAGEKGEEVEEKPETAEEKPELQYGEIEIKDEKIEEILEKAVPKGDEFIEEIEEHPAEVSEEETPQKSEEPIENITESITGSETYATQTIAEILAKQGYTKAAIEIYRSILSNPDLETEKRQSIKKRIAELEKILEEEGENTT